MLPRPPFLREPVIAVPLAIATLIALFGRESWAGSPFWPATFIRGMESLFPPIAAHAAKSDFPATTSLYMAICFLLLPLHGWHAYRELTKPTDKAWYRNLWSLRSRWSLLGRLAAVLLILVIAMFALFAPVAYDFNLLPYHSSRVALAAAGWLVAGAAQGGMLAWIYCNLVVISRFLRSYGDPLR